MALALVLIAYSPGVENIAGLTRPRNPFWEQIWKDPSLLTMSKFAASVLDWRTILSLLLFCVITVEI